MPIPRGYSRDHRPDLNQVMLALMVEHQAGMPVLMKPLSGKSSDGPELGHIIRKHVAQLQTTYGTTYLVADSALYSDDNLQKLAATAIKGIPRVPATISAAQAALHRLDPQALAPLTDGSRSHAVASTYGGVAQRWVLLYSEHRQAQAQRTVAKQWHQQSDQDIQAFKKLCSTPCACEADARQALGTVEQTLQATFLTTSTVRAQPRYGKRGRPGPDRQPAHVSYHIDGA